MRYVFIFLFVIQYGYSIDKVYVLNLEIRHEKWINTQTQLIEQGLPQHLTPNRFLGINGWTLERKKLKDLYRKHVKKEHIKYLTYGQLGCFLSHKAILEDAVFYDYNCIWVLEDDVLVLQPLNTIEQLIDKLNTIDSEWDVLFTDLNTRGAHLKEIWTFEDMVSSSFDYSLVKDPSFVPFENEYFKRIECRLGTHSMVISKNGIKKLLEYFQSSKISYPIDVQMHCCPDKRFYASKVEYVTHGERHGSDTSYKPN